MDISEILSSLSEEDMEQLKRAASAIMGGSGTNASGGEKTENTQKNTDFSNMFNSQTVENLSKISKAMSGDDDRTALIKALKPMLSEEKQQRADEVIKIIKLLEIFPLLRDSGLMKGLL